MTFITDIIKGVFIGIANIIPGVSGGTIALSMGIYDKLIGAVSNFLKDWKKSIITLLPILVGCGLGLIGFTYAIEYLLSEHTFFTCMAFIGLILGGLPVLIRQLLSKTKEHGGSVGISGVLAFVILFAFAIILPLFGSEEEVLKTLTASPQLMVIMFFIGIIASATMVIPGVSGSLVLMILGYYYGIIGSIKDFLEALKVFDIPALTNGFLILFPLGIGILLGIFLIAKLITFLFEKYGVQTYCAILGLILSSPFAIFYNTGLFGKLDQLNLLMILGGILIFIVGAVVTYLLGEK
ncbi:DUF368 domain-containing protein [Clostridium sp. AN503]|uniref:DUF368 domain-containing protein n=1 Tax=Clostridium sp. AN503 TaxID=3160598 RepID=UPI00345AB7B0